MQIENEIWKNVSEIGVVPDSNGKLIDLSPFDDYWVSTMGRVYNSKMKRFLPEEGKGYNKKGYLLITLSKFKKKLPIVIHRLIGYAFISNPKHLPQVNHRNEQKDDNRVENLEWCDAKYNNNYGTKNQRMVETFKTSKKWKEGHKRMVETFKTSKKFKEGRKRTSEKNTNGKCSKRVYQYSLENSLIDIYPSTNECGRNGFSQCNISTCCQGKQKTSYGFKWSYEPPEKKTTLRRCSFGALTLKSYDIKKVG